MFPVLVRSILIAAVLLTASGPPLRAQALPPGLRDVEVATGFASLTSIAEFPDGRLLLTEQIGGIHVLTPSGRTRIGQITGLLLGSEAGLLGGAVDPAFPARPFAYVVHSDAATTSIIVSRLRLGGALTDRNSGALSILERVPLLLVPSPDGNAHVGATARFGPDGSLFVSIGDGTNACSAQNLAGDLRGRILRLQVSDLPIDLVSTPDPSALIPNRPVFGAATVETALSHAIGLRNPFKFHVDPVTGDVLVADVGEILSEEINRAGGGENFGWPRKEGSFVGPASCQAVGMAETPPIYEYDRSLSPTLASLITVGVYRGPYPGPQALGPEYEGSLFFTDLFAGFLRRLVEVGGRWVPAPAVPGQPHPQDWAFGLSDVGGGLIARDGTLYYLSRPSSVRRILRVPGPDRLEVIAGADQVGVSGRLVGQPLIVRARDESGQPIAGTPVSFAASGGGTFSSNSVVTDAQGRATVGFTLPPGYTGRPVTITARLPRGDSTAARVVWRGLLSRGVVPGPVYPLVHLGFIHSEMNSPFTLAFEFGSPQPLATPFGTIETGFLTPNPDTIVLDGLGLVGPPLPGLRTLPNAPFVETGIPSVPQLSGRRARVQAYAIDFSRYPDEDAFVITPAITLFFP